MSDYQNEFVGNDTAEVVDNAEQSTDAKVNPGAIRKSTTNGILNALSNASGQSFESVEAAIAYMARTSAQQGSAPVGHAQPVEQPRQSNGRVTTNDLHEQFQRLQSDLTRKEQALREKELDSEIMKVMNDKFDPDFMDYAINKVKSNVQWNDDGTYSIVNQKGQERYGMDGNPLSISGLVNEVARGNPKLLKQSNLSGGSGLRQNGNFAGAPEDGIPDYSKDPAAFNAWAQRNGIGKRMGLKGATVSVESQAMSRKVL